MKTVLLAAPLLLALFTGCGLFGSDHGSDSQATLFPAVNSPISDVPVPAGFNLDMKNSKARVEPTMKLRYVNHRYTGKDATLAVVRFYRTQLPTQGWSEPQLTQEGDTVTLRSTKAGEDLSMSIRQGQFNTELWIKIDPTGRNTRP